MYIPDDEWDEIVSMALELSEMPDVIASAALTIFTNSIINLEDKPGIRKKRTTQKGFHRIRKSRDQMRSFSKYFICLYASKRIKDHQEMRTD